MYSPHQYIIYKGDDVLYCDIENIEEIRKQWKYGGTQKKGNCWKHDCACVDEPLEGEDICYSEDNPMCENCVIDMVVDE